MSKEFRRREILRHFLAVTLISNSYGGASNSRAQAQSAKAAKRRHVLVVGAGMAGIKATHDLQKAGARVTLVEGRQRIGGRIHSSKAWGAGLTIDLGAAWIQGARGNPLWDLARKTGTKTYRMDEESWAFYGESGRPADISASLERRFTNALENAIDRAKSGHSIDVALTASQFWTRFNNREAAAVRYLLHTYIEQEYATDLSELSASNFDEGKSLRGGDYLIPGGYVQLCTALSGSNQAKLGTRVTRIRQTKSGFEAETTKGKITANAVIVTVPLGVLKRGSIDFQPDLPDSIQSAIQALGMGTMNKCVLRFDRPFWPAETEWIGRACRGPGPWREFVNLLPVSGQPVLIGPNVGSTARDLERLSDRKIADAMMQSLREMFGSKAPNPTGIQVTRWSSDPFSYGSYSHLPPSASPSHRRALGTPFSDGHIILAGEASSIDYPATVQGAWLSGERAAKLIAKRLGI